MRQEEVAEIQVATNQLMAKCMPLQVIKHGERILDTMPFFILQRPYEKPHIYARIEKVRYGLVAMGHRWSTKRLSMAFRNLGHRPENFKWGRKNIRGWAMEMAAIAGDGRHSWRCAGHDSAFPELMSYEGAGRPAPRGVM